jgi:tetratricopeptide (TPR) repeat protein
VSGDTENAIQNFRLFLQAMKGQWLPEDLRSGAQFFIKLRKDCEHLPNCMSTTSELTHIVFDVFENASQSTITSTKTAALFYLGQIYSSEGLLDEAISSYSQAVAVEPDNVVYRVHLGSILGAARRYEEGNAQLLKALQFANTDDEKSWVFGELGYVALSADQVQEAIGQFEKSVRLGTKDDSYRVGLGRAYWKAERLADALQTFTEVVHIAPKRSEAWMYLGMFLSEQANWDEAVSALSQAVDLMPQNVSYRLALANALVNNGSESEATRQFQTILDLDPNNADALYYLSHISRSSDEK